MPKSQIDIFIEPRKVRVDYDAIRISPYGRFYAGLLYFAFGIGILCLVLFAPGKHGASSVWQDLHASAAKSFNFRFPLGLMFLFLGFLAWSIPRAVRIVYPGAQKLECDGSTLTISWIRWMDWRNREWITQSYPLLEVSGIRYGIILSGRGNSIHGLRLRAGGRSYKLFPKLTTHQAGKILAGLEVLGVETDRREKVRQRSLARQ